MSTLSPLPQLGLLTSRRRSLDSFFLPRAVAVIGASETAGSVGRTVFANLTRGSFSGTVHPVNPKRSTVLGRTAYRDVSNLPGPVDLAIVITPAVTVPGVIRDCAAAKIGAA